VEDASPVYSPFGDRIAFGRKALEQDKWTPGRQLWVMRADGSDARALTNDPLYNHSAFVWSPDGTLIVYVRFDVTDPASTPEIWMMSADGVSSQKLVAGGYLPQWLP
jgi:TolB protein